MLPPRLARSLACLPLILGGCSGVTWTEPMAMTMPATAGPAATMSGPSLDDALHQVRRYVHLHHPTATLVALRSEQVDAGGHIAAAGAWHFTYQARPAAPPVVSSPAPASASIMLVVPATFETTQLVFTLTGTRQLLAPEEAPATEVQGAGLDYDQVLPLSGALELAQTLGMVSGPAGVAVTLRMDGTGRAIYELDNSRSYASTAKGWAGDGSGSGYGELAPRGGIEASGKFILEARTGALLRHPLTD